jgi:hypothetical protein
VGNFIASEDIKSARDVIEVVQSRTPELQPHANVL